MAGPDDIPVEVMDDDRPDPGTAHQPPRTDPLTDPPPRHDPFAHGNGAPPPRGWDAPLGADSFPPPPRVGAEPRRLRGDERRLHDKLTQTYATVGIVVCAAAQTRMTMLGPSDPVGGRFDPDRERARKSCALMYQAGTNTVQMAPAAADSWLETAKEVPAVKRALDRYMEGGAIAGLVMVHALMAVPYGVAAGWIPEVIGERMATVGAAMGAAAADGDD